MAKDKPSRSREVANKVIFAALQILKERGGQAPEFYPKLTDEDKSLVPLVQIHFYSPSV